MSNQLNELLDRFKSVVEGTAVPRPTGQFTNYAITNFRGGIGKSTLSFNLAWEISRDKKSLLLDVCPQCNFTQSLIGDEIDKSTITIYDALLPRVMAGTPEINIDDLLVAYLHIVFLSKVEAEYM